MKINKTLAFTLIAISTTFSVVLADTKSENTSVSGNNVHWDLIGNDRWLADDFGQATLYWYNGTASSTPIDKSGNGLNLNASLSTDSGSVVATSTKQTRAASANAYREVSGWSGKFWIDANYGFNQWTKSVWVNS